MVTAHLGTQKNVIPKLEGLGHVSSHFPLTDGLSGPRIKLFHRTLNCLFYRLLRALIGGRVNEKASSGNVITEFPEE